MLYRRNKRRKILELHPDEILLDARNLPQFDMQQFEGRVERPIAKKSLQGLYWIMIFIAVFFVGRLGILQIIHAQEYALKSEQNSLEHIPIFADRGVIYDRTGVELAWNIPSDGTSPTIRKYTDTKGFASLVGYVTYPAKDAKGKYWQVETIGKDGIEKEFNASLTGVNGTKLVETNVSGEVLGENTIDTPIQGNNVSLSIDARMQSALFDGIAKLSESSGYIGGAGGIMDIRTGELLALTSFPEYDQSVMSLAKDKAVIASYMQSEARPFLNRMTDGLYTPGSIVKPFLALAALHEGIVTPDTTIVSTGSLRIPNPYNPENFTVFKDNKAHGAVDMKRALAVSSNIYFYQIGGGFGAQKGLGISLIEKYVRMFGIGEKTGISVSSEKEGTIPSVAWKQKRFPGDPWRVGDTYNTSIGQYGFQVTPIQMLRAVSAIASRGILVEPTIQKKNSTEKNKFPKLPFTDAAYSEVHEGMRMVVTEGTAPVLNHEAISVAAKTGTAQIKGNTRVNSWVIGFFPVEQPRYAFVVLMEDGPKVSSGAAHAFRPVLDLFAAEPSLLTE